MIFTSFVFPIFLLLTLALYYGARRSLRAQNWILLAASYVFYGWWDFRFLSLIMFSTCVDFWVAKRMASEESQDMRKRLMWVSVGLNLGLLGFFKYTNFFADSLVLALAGVGVEVDWVTLNIVLPVGISFYTFQTLSYTIDVYRRKMQPTESLLEFAVFVAFFPQLVAGPIERASHFLPQVAKARSVDASDVHSGLFLILWGFFKKLVIADNLATVANPIFANPDAYQGPDLWIAALAFTFQIFCDFSAYSDIARGCARLMGFDLMVNFRLPYFSETPSEFWRRWHISLSSWLRDYLYIPLGGNRNGKNMTLRNLFLTMLLGGLWHGAAANFIVWGAWQGTVLLVYRQLGIKENDGVKLTGRALVRIAIFFTLTVFGWIIFRAENMATIVHFSGALWLPGVPSDPKGLAMLLASVAFLMPLQLWQHKSGDLLCFLKLPPLALGLFYGILLSAICFLSAAGPVEFLYFQF